MVIQVCFQIKDDEHNNYVIQKLKEIKETLNKEDRIISCHLPRQIVVDKGWSTQMVDALEDIFGSQYECYVKTIRRTTRTKRTDTLFPSTTLFRSKKSEI